MNGPKPHRRAKLGSYRKPAWRLEAEQAGVDLDDGLADRLLLADREARAMQFLGQENEVGAGIGVEEGLGRRRRVEGEVLGFELVVACPADYAPTAAFLQKLNAPNVTITHDPVAAAKDAHVINTDVWLSMGQEEQKEKELAFGPFQVNAELLAHASPGHIVLHCLPAYRGKEITEEVLENHASVIFQQAENRLYAQKAVLVAVAKKSQG